MTDKEQTHIFAMNLNKQISKTGKRQNEVAKDLGVSSTTLNNWCREVSMPKAGAIQNIADYFGVGKTALLNEEVEQGETSAVMIKKFNRLTPENQSIIMTTMDAMLATQSHP